MILYIEMLWLTSFFFAFLIIQVYSHLATGHFLLRSSE